MMNLRNKNRYFRISAVALLISIVCVSCFTVSYSTTGASISPDLKTLSIVTFQNRSAAPPSFAQDFTDAFVSKCRSNTKLTIVTEGGEANFEGEIVGYDAKPTAIQGNETAAQNRLTITVHVRYNNSVDPKFNYDSNFSRYKDYPSSQSLEQAATAYSADLIDQLTEDIFNKAFVNW
jgi:hypothetical protein